MLCIEICVGCKFWEKGLCKLCNRRFIRCRLDGFFAEFTTAVVWMGFLTDFTWLAYFWKRVETLCFESRACGGNVFVKSLKHWNIFEIVSGWDAETSHQNMYIACTANWYFNPLHGVMMWVFWLKQLMHVDGLASWPTQLCVKKNRGNPEKERKWHHKNGSRVLVLMIKKKLKRTCWTDPIPGSLWWYPSILFLV